MMPGDSDGLGERQTNEQTQTDRQTESHTHTLDSHLHSYE